MAEISASKVKELRDKTGAGMMDCKNALEQANGDFALALENLRKQGIVKAEKKSGRSTKQGIIQICAKGGAQASMVEVLCETDFVAKNEKFKAYAAELTEKVSAMPGNGDISEAVQNAEKPVMTEMIATIGENMQIRRALKWSSESGVCASYLHLGGKIGVIIDASGEVSNPVALKDICMHIAAFRPTYICPDCIPADVVAKEKEIAASLPELSGKPKEVLDKILTGKIAKWQAEVCLTKQPWLRDDKLSVEKANPGVKVNRFVRWEVGEEL